MQDFIYSNESTDPTQASLEKYGEEGKDSQEGSIWICQEYQWEGKERSVVGQWNLSQAVS